MENIVEERSHIVRKSNILIQKGHNDYSQKQLKALSYIVSQVKYDATGIEPYTVDIRTFCRCCGIDIDSGKNYADLKTAIKALRDRSTWIKDGNRQMLISWIDTCTIDGESGTITVILSKAILPYITQLRRDYTSYTLAYVLNLSSKYAIRLYELIKSVHYNEMLPYTYTTTMEDLRSIMSAETYSTIRDFKRRALEPAIQDINRATDKSVNISYHTQGRGGKIVRVDLEITSKPAVERTLLCMCPPKSGEQSGS